MTRRVLVHPAAAQELVEAAVVHDGWRPGLGDELLRRVDVATEDVLHAPEAWPVENTVRPGVVIRARRVRGFPFRLVYLQADGDIVVVAYAHTRREPGYWVRRLS